MAEQTFLQRKTAQKAFKSVMKSYHFKIPKYDMPLRLRPWFLVLTTLVMLILAFLGFTNFSHSLPLNDKLLHFLCFGLATFVFYFIIDVEEDARRIWFWRHSNAIFTCFVCLFCGGILSEFVQSMLPYKDFQIGDVVANLLGSGIGLLGAYHAERYYRHRREIARLYRPLDADVSESEEEEVMGGTQLLPTHNDPSRKLSKQPTRLADVWDEREELFGIGSDDENDEATSSRAGPPPSAVPKITVSNA